MNMQTMLLEDGSHLVLVHFVYRSSKGLASGVGLPLTDHDDQTYKVACVPNLQDIHMHAMPSKDHPVQRTDDPRAVSCPNCKMTRVFQEALAIQPVKR